MPRHRPKPPWRSEHRTCPYCQRVFLPKQINQIYCRKSHKEMASRRRPLERGDVRVVKVCPFTAMAFHQGEPLFLRCMLEVGHKTDHLLPVALESVFDSKTDPGAGNRGGTDA